MLRFGMLSLIGSVSFGVFGFGGSLSASSGGAQILSLACLAFSAIGFLGGVLANPTGLPETRTNGCSIPGQPANDYYDEETR